MTDKNPYETNEETNIPNFVSNDKNEDTVDVSIFKMSDDELYDESEESSSSGSLLNRKLNGKTLIIGAIVCAVLLIGLIGCLIFGISQKKQVSAWEEKYNTYVAAATSKETSYLTQIADLNKQIEELKNPKIDPADDVDGEGTSYIVQFDGIHVRKGPGTSYDDSEVADLPDYFEKYGNGPALYTGNVVKVIETVKDGEYVWGKLADKAYFAISKGSEIYAKESK